MPSANFESDSSPHFSGNEQLLVCIGAFIASLFVHILVQQNFSAEIESASTAVFSHPVMTFKEQHGHLKDGILLAISYAIPASISTIVSAILSNIPRLKLGTAFALWITLLLLVSFTWGVIARQFDFAG
jgi:hypothetical protein